MKYLLILSILIFFGCKEKEVQKINEKSTLFIFNCEKLQKLTKIKTIYYPYSETGGSCGIHRSHNIPLVIDDERELFRIIYILENTKLLKGESNGG